MSLQDAILKQILMNLPESSDSSSDSTSSLENSDTTSSEALSVLGRKICSVVRTMMISLFVLAFWAVGMSVALFVAPLWLFLALLLVGVIICLFSLRAFNKSFKRF